jgi:hypothetical protein
MCSVLPAAGRAPAFGSHWRRPVQLASPVNDIRHGRVRTTRVWVRGGQAWRQGNLLTAVLWLATLAVHLGYDRLVYPVTPGRPRSR